MIPPVDEILNHFHSGTYSEDISDQNIPCNQLPLHAVVADVSQIQQQETQYKASETHPVDPEQQPDDAINQEQTREQQTTVVEETQQIVETQIESREVEERIQEAEREQAETQQRLIEEEQVRMRLVEEEKQAMQ